MSTFFKFIGDSIADFAGNYIIMSAIISWILAQIIKVFTAMFQKKKIDLKRIMFCSGGMPSSHSASIVSVAVACGLKEGFGSAIFAVAAVISIIVMIDASGVRYETGRQGFFLNKIAKYIFAETPEELDMGFKEIVGHTPFQVTMGALLGGAISIIMYFVYNI